MRYSCYANGFGSTLTLPTFVFFFFTFFQAYMLPLGVSVRATVWVKARVNFRVYTWFVSTKPTALSLCVTVTSQVAYE